MLREPHKEQKGYFTFARNTTDIDYLRLAYLQALSIKKTQNVNSYAVAIDEDMINDVPNAAKEVFDFIITIPGSSKDIESNAWKLGDEWKAWWITPYKETIKLDCDMTFNRNIDHWWNIMQVKDVLFTTKIVNYLNEESDARNYRKLFDDNRLPNIYTAFFYFRYTELSARLFDLARQIYQNWPIFRDEILINCRDEFPTTDVVFSLGAMILGEEQFTLPDSIIPKIVHMKGAIQGWGIDEDWTTKLYSQIDERYNHTVGFTRQLYPFHYHQKYYATDEVIKKYD